MEHTLSVFYQKAEEEQLVYQFHGCIKRVGYGHATQLYCQIVPVGQLWCNNKKNVLLSQKHFPDRPPLEDVYKTGHLRLQTRSNATLCKHDVFAKPSRHFLAHALGKQFSFKWLGTILESGIQTAHPNEPWALIKTTQENKSAVSSNTATMKSWSNAVFPAMTCVINSESCAGKESKNAETLNSYNWKMPSSRVSDMRFDNLKVFLTSSLG